jgi:hypothetical protein
VAAAAKRVVLLPECLQGRLEYAVLLYYDGRYGDAWLELGRYVEALVQQQDVVKQQQPQQEEEEEEGVGKQQEERKQQLQEEELKEEERQQPPPPQQQQQQDERVQDLSEEQQRMQVALQDLQGPATGAAEGAWLLQAQQQQEEGGGRGMKRRGESLQEEGECDMALPLGSEAHQQQQQEEEEEVMKSGDETSTLEGKQQQEQQQKKHLQQRQEQQQLLVRQWLQQQEEEQLAVMPRTHDCDADANDPNQQQQQQQQQQQLAIPGDVSILVDPNEAAVAAAAAQGLDVAEQPPDSSTTRPWRPRTKSFEALHTGSTETALPGFSRTGGAVQGVGARHQGSARGRGVGEEAGDLSREEGEGRGAVVVDADVLILLEKLKLELMLSVRG